MEYNEYVRDNSSTADDSAKGEIGFSKIEGLPHRHANLGFVEVEHIGQARPAWAQILHIYPYDSFYVGPGLITHVICK